MRDRSCNSIRPADDASMKKKRAKKRPDPATFGFAVMQHVVEASGDAPDAPVKPEDKGKDPAAVALGRKGGLKGGPARAKKLGKKLREAAQRWRPRAGARGDANRSPILMLNGDAGAGDVACEGLRDCRGAGPPGVVRTVQFAKGESDEGL